MKIHSYHVMINIHFQLLTSHHSSELNLKVTFPRKLSPATEVRNQVIRTHLTTPCYVNSVTSPFYLEFPKNGGVYYLSVNPRYAV